MSFRLKVHSGSLCGNLPKSLVEEMDLTKKTEIIPCVKKNELVFFVRPDDKTPSEIKGLMKISIYGKGTSLHFFIPKSIREEHEVSHGWICTPFFDRNGKLWINIRRPRLEDE